YDESLALTERALAIYTRVLGDTDLQTASTLSFMADLYYRKGDYTKAEFFASKASLIMEANPDREDMELIGLLSILGDVYRAKSDFSEAESVYLRGLAICEKAANQEANVFIPYIQTKLARIYTERGNYDKAEPLFVNALKRYEDLTGKENS